MNNDPRLVTSVHSPSWIQHFTATDFLTRCVWNRVCRTCDGAAFCLHCCGEHHRGHDTVRAASGYSAVDNRRDSFCIVCCVAFCSDLCAHHHGGGKSHEVVPVYEHHPLQSTGSEERQNRSFYTIRTFADEDGNLTSQSIQVINRTDDEDEFNRGCLNSSPRSEERRTRSFYTIRTFANEDGSLTLQSIQVINRTDDEDEFNSGCLNSSPRTSSADSTPGIAFPTHGATTSDPARSAAASTNEATTPPLPQTTKAPGSTGGTRSASSVVSRSAPSCAPIATTPAARNSTAIGSSRGAPKRSGGSPMPDLNKTLEEQGWEQ